MKNVYGFKTIVSCVISLGFFAPGWAAAEEAGKWNTEASIYLYLPEIKTDTSYPTSGRSVSATSHAGPGAQDIGITSDQVLDSLDGMFMGAIDVHNGQWGAFLDLVYFKLGAEKNSAKNGATNMRGNFDLEYKGTAVTMAGQYRVASAPEFKMDVLAGARMFKIDTSLDWDITSGGGALPPTGSASMDSTLWDGIVGLKGRFAFGDSLAWSVPFYVDIGTGDSDRTAQAMLGLAYSFKWGRISGGYRWVDYDLEDNSRTQNVTFDGPMLGATFTF